MCFPYFEAGELNRAIPHLRKALELDRNFHHSRVLLAFCYHLSGKTSEASVEFQTLGQLAPDLPIALGALGYFYGVTGRPEDARKMLGELDQMVRKRYVPSWARAIVYIGLGQKSPALDWLEKGCEEHDGWMWTLSRDPWYDPLRKEPRFQALLKKVGPNK
jgi:Tfp pilus assembly protein PilF